ncbi:unnamed protein product [Schistocephalus solidus]|uniref:RING-type E3 ubiquitin transferase n=1 Tax=Schistocephalus solidus TaxID=70667 RepID=A0A0X3PC92_SCHSO|nr:unnamed protein product [Schistocephalus solidus]
MFRRRRPAPIVPRPRSPLCSSTALRPAGVYRSQNHLARPVPLPRCPNSSRCHRRRRRIDRAMSTPDSPSSRSVAQLSSLVPSVALFHPPSPQSPSSLSSSTSSSTSSSFSSSGNFSSDATISFRGWPSPQRKVRSLRSSLHCPSSASSTSSRRAPITRRRSRLNSVTSAPRENSPATANAGSQSTYSVCLDIGRNADAGVGGGDGGGGGLSSDVVTWSSRHQPKPTVSRSTSLFHLIVSPGAETSQGIVTVMSRERAPRRCRLSLTAGRNQLQPSVAGSTDSEPSHTHRNYNDGGNQSSLTCCTCQPSPRTSPRADPYASASAPLDLSTPRLANSLTAAGTSRGNLGSSEIIPIDIERDRSPLPSRRKRKKQPSFTTSAVEDCVICLSQQVNRSILLPCMHTYCFQCITTWVLVNPICPLCKGVAERILHSIISDSQYDEVLVSVLRSQQDLVRDHHRLNARLHRFMHTVNPSSMRLGREPGIWSRMLFTRTLDSEVEEPSTVMMESPALTSIVDQHQLILASLVAHALPEGAPAYLEPDLVRQLIYLQNLYSVILSADLTPSDFRACIRPSFLAENEALTHRLVAFVRRELQAMAPWLAYMPDPSRVTDAGRNALLPSVCLAPLRYGPLSPDSETPYLNDLALRVVRHICNVSLLDSAAFLAFMRQEPALTTQSLISDATLEHFRWELEHFARFGSSLDRYDSLVCLFRYSLLQPGGSGSQPQALPRQLAVYVGPGVGSTDGSEWRGGGVGQPVGLFKSFLISWLFFRLFPHYALSSSNHPSNLVGQSPSTTDHARNTRCLRGVFSRRTVDAAISTLRHRVHSHTSPDGEEGSQARSCHHRACEQPAVIACSLIAHVTWFSLESFAWRRAAQRRSASQIISQCVIRELVEHTRFAEALAPYLQDGGAVQSDPTSQLLLAAHATALTRLRGLVLLFSSNSPTNSRSEANLRRLLSARLLHTSPLLGTMEETTAGTTSSTLSDALYMFDRLSSRQLELQPVVNLADTESAEDGNSAQTINGSSERSFTFAPTVSNADSISWSLEIEPANNRRCQEPSSFELIQLEEDEEPMEVDVLVEEVEEEVLRPNNPTVDRRSIIQSLSSRSVEQIEEECRQEPDVRHEGNFRHTMTGLTSSQPIVLSDSDSDLSYISPVTSPAQMAPLNPLTSTTSAATGACCDDHQAHCCCCIRHLYPALPSPEQWPLALRSCFRRLIDSTAVKSGLPSGSRVRTTASSGFNQFLGTNADTSSSPILISDSSDVEEVDIGLRKRRQSIVLLETEEQPKPTNSHEFAGGAAEELVASTSTYRPREPTPLRIVNTKYPDAIARPTTAAEFYAILNQIGCSPANSVHADVNTYYEKKTDVSAAYPSGSTLLPQFTTTTATVLPEPTSVFSIDSMESDLHLPLPVSRRSRVNRCDNAPRYRSAPSSPQSPFIPRSSSSS